MRGSGFLASCGGDGGLPTLREPGSGGQLSWAGSVSGPSTAPRPVGTPRLLERVWYGPASQHRWALSVCPHWERKEGARWDRWGVHPPSPHPTPASLGAGL